MNWLLYNALGALCLGICNSFFRSNPWDWPVWLLLLSMIPLTTLGTQLGFLKAYQLAPTFLQAWLTGSALSVAVGWSASVLVFGEPIKAINILAVGLIFVGAWLLT